MCNVYIYMLSKRSLMGCLLVGLSVGHLVSEPMLRVRDVFSILRQRCGVADSALALDGVQAGEKPGLIFPSERILSQPGWSSPIARSVARDFGLALQGSHRPCPEGPGLRHIPVCFERVGGNLSSLLSSFWSPVGLHYHGFSVSHNDVRPTVPFQQDPAQQNPATRRRLHLPPPPGQWWSFCRFPSACRLETLHAVQLSWQKQVVFH